ncbi:MAG TPA: alpha/beta hydrolase [Allosphingosinicella sp.]|nr:alpha/beta hydrolase [Allosphingosinicella sp.]
MIVGLVRLVLKIIGWLLALLVAALMVFRMVAWARETEDGRPAQSTLVATPLGQVAVQLSGPEGGRRIVLIGGTAGWSGFWRNVAAHLAARGWRVVAVDLPPFGYSEHDAQGRYDRASQAARLEAVRAALGGEGAVVVGHSFGAGAALELALRSHGLSRLVLVDPALGPLDPPAQGGSWALRQSWIMQPVTSASMTNPLLTGRLLRSMLARTETADAWVETIGQPMRRRGTTAAYAAWLPALFASDDGGLSFRSAEVRRLRVPLHLIWGEADTVTPIAQGEALARVVRPASFARLPGTGHIPHIEDEARFLAALDAAIGEPR